MGISQFFTHLRFYFKNCYFLMEVNFTIDLTDRFSYGIRYLNRAHYCVNVECIMFSNCLFFFFSFFCKPCPALWNFKSVFLIVKISEYGGSRRWVQLFRCCSCKNWYQNWYLHFHKTYNQCQKLTLVVTWFFYHVFKSWNQKIGQGDTSRKVLSPLLKSLMPPVSSLVT